MELKFYYLNYNIYYRIDIGADIVLVKNPHAVFYVKKIINKNINNFEKINISECVEDITDKSKLIDFFYEESFYDEQIVSLKEFSVENNNFKISSINIPYSKVIYQNIKKYLLKIRKKHLFFKLNITTNQLIVYIYYDDFFYKIVCNNVVSYYNANESFRNEIWNPRNKYSERKTYKISNICEMKNSLFISFVKNNYFKEIEINKYYTEYLISDKIGEENISVICSPDIEVNKLNY